MTTLEEDVSVEVETPTEETPESKKKGRKRDLDFNTAKEHHQELADYVNQHSGLDPVTGNQVKAILTLKQDWSATPEQEAKRASAKAAREAAAEKYKGLTPEQITQEKAAEKAEKQAAKLRQRVEDALARAKAIREGKSATGEDIATAVEADQSQDQVVQQDLPGQPEPEQKRGRFGRNR